MTKKVTYTGSERENKEGVYGPHAWEWLQVQQNPELRVPFLGISVSSPTWCGCHAPDKSFQARARQSWLCHHQVFSGPALGPALLPEASVRGRRGTRWRGHHGCRKVGSKHLTDQNRQWRCSDPQKWGKDPGLLQQKGEIDPGKEWTTDVFYKGRQDGCRERKPVHFLFSGSH